MDTLYNGLSIYHTKNCKTTFLALPHLSYIIFNRPVVGKTTLLRQKSQQAHCYYRIATKHAKAYQYLLLWFQYNIDKQMLQGKYDSTINFVFFYLITWDSFMVWAWNLVCGRFLSFRKGRKILTLLTFGCSSYNFEDVVQGGVAHPAEELVT